MTGVAGVLTATIIGGALYSDSSVSLARPSLPGIEDIVNTNSMETPFKILEIVDQYDSARIGYTVAGEEPGDKNSADAISDMASEGERHDRYMTGTTSTSGTTPYQELDTWAFTWDTAGYAEDSTTIDVNTPNVRSGKSYGSFEGSTSPKRYDAADTSTLYKPVSEDGGVDGNLTIEQVVNRHEDSDGSGIFYMDYVEYRKALSTDTDTDPTYTIELSEVDDTNSWMKPFQSYTDTSITPNVLYYNNARYVIDTAYEAEIDFKDAADDTDDVLVLKNTPELDDVLFLLDNITNKLVYYGYIAQSGSDLVFINATGTTYPLSGGYDIVTDSATAGDESLAGFVYILGDIYTIRLEGSGEAALTKYYVSSTTLDANGRYKIDLYEKDPVNNPSMSIDTYGIGDESGKTPAWYHKWFYKPGNQKPYIYKGDGNGNYDYRHDYSGPVVDEYYYTGGYTNKERFKREVLDVEEADCPNVCIDVITKKLQDVTADDINSANLIYITGNSHYDDDGTGNPIDMSVEAATALISAVDEKHKAVVLNLKAMYGDATATWPVYSKIDTNYDNFKYVLTLLMQNDVDGIGGYVSNGAWNVSPEKWAALKQLALAYYTSSIVAANDMSHVSRSVFINDDIQCGDAILNDFNTAYSQSKIDGFTLDGKTYDGFKDVKTDIDEEKFYLEVANKDVSKFNDVICKATSIRYILNYGDRRVVAKTKLRVLDIEPFYNRDFEKSKDYNSYLAPINSDPYYANNYPNNWAEIRDIFDRTWYSTNFGDSTRDISVYGTGVREFVGKLEDLNENYDLIYIGMDTAYLVTKSPQRTNKQGKLEYYSGAKTKEVVGNSRSGYVYDHIGDTLTITDGSIPAGTYNMSGRDITPDKVRELQNYVKAGYAMILSDEFFDYNSNGSLDGIDTDRVDPNSYMYDFVKWCMDEGYLYKNVEIKKNFEAASTTGTTNGKTALEHKESFVKYLNISKLEVEVMEQPPLYNKYDGTTTHDYIGMDPRSGLYTMNFKFKLKNDAAVDTTNTTYDCKLYIDHDADGRFETIEALDSLIIYNDDTGDAMSVDSSGKYNLVTGATYTLSRRVPEGYVGLIPWKLVFIENGRDTDLIKVAVQDYSAISDITNTPTIRILQLTTGDTDSTNLDLKNDATLKQYYSQITDFNISVDKDRVSNFIKNDGTGSIFNGGDRLEKLCDYDMLVLGFWDMFDFPNSGTKAEEAILAVREYAMSGRAILFTHDLTTQNFSDSTSWGYLADLYLRDIQGMDRYHWTERYLNGKTYLGKELTPYNSLYDEKLEDYKGTVGLTNSELLRYNDKSKTGIGDIGRAGTSNIGNAREMQTVTRVNRGQITEYPFRIGDLIQTDTNRYEASELIKVATTHNQYFQLNLETNYLDENYDDDVVVWYTLSAPLDSSLNYFKLNYNDVRNNYYIFNKGNITYTGAGHSKISDNQETGNAEKKLFVNTLVAAYNAAVHAPYAAYKSNDNINANDITSQYIPYDIAMGQPVEDGGDNNGWLDTKVTIYFKTINNELKDNQKTLIAQYYVEVPSNGDLTVGTKQYKIITPASMYDCTTGTGITGQHNTLANGRIYKMEFNISDLMLGKGVDERYHAVIYTRMRTQTMTTWEQDIADMAEDDGTTLPALDSFKPLNINFTQLYDLQ